MQRKNKSMPVASVPVEAGDLRELVRAVALELKRQLERRAGACEVESAERPETKDRTTKRD